MPAEEQEFEYHIQFPTPKDTNGISTSTINEVNQVNAERGDGDENQSQRKERRRPPVENIWPVDITPNIDEKDIVIVLLGWAGSQQKHLAKYSDIYLNRGCIVLRYITPVNLLFANLDKLGSMTHQLVTVLQDLQLDSNPIFFHTFSNGGGVTYSSFLHEMNLVGANLDIRGTIFDSAPSPRSMKTCFKALLEIYGSSNWLRYFMAAGVTLLLMLSIFWHHIKTALRFCLSGDIIRANKRCGTIRNEDGPTQNWLARISQYQYHNFLFIYSEKDELIPWNKVEEFATILSKRQNHVKYLKFVDSPHVRHYLLHPQEYVEAVVGFIRGVMNSGTNKSELKENI